MSKYVQLGDIAKIYSGGTPSRTKPAYWGGNIPWVKTGQIQNNLIREDSVDEWITQQGLKYSSAKMVPKGTILMAMYGQGKTRGQVAILGLDAAINQACAAIDLGKESNRDFVFQQLLFRYNTIRSLSNTGGQENLNSGLIREIEILLPSLSEQAAIANLLSAWDQAIEKTGRLIASKEKYLSVLKQKLLTGKKRINGYNESWQRYRLSKVLVEHGALSTGQEKVYSVSVHKGLVDQIEHLGRSFAAKNTANYNLVKPGDIVYTKSPTGDFPYGIIKQSQLDYPVIVSPLYGVFTPKTKQLGSFLHFYFESPVNIGNYLRPLIQKGAKNTIGISNSTFLTNSLFLPPCDDETEAIAATLRATRQEIDLLKKQADTYRKQKRGLMQKLLTGRWRVKIHRG
ncbi:MAG: restriction endonuclease subunit S [Thermodesulfobacteriota bacterium]